MGIIWTSREVFTGDRKSGLGSKPEKPLIAGVATVAGAVTPAPVLQDPLAPSSPNRCERLGEGKSEYTPSDLPSFKWRRRGLIAALVVDVALWWLIVSVGIAVYRWLK